MVNISPDQEIWTAIRLLISNKGYDVFDYLPGDGTPYPFVFMGEQFNQSDIQSKDSLRHATQVTIHVWHNDVEKRGTTSKMMGDIESLLWSMRQTNTLRLQITNIDKQIMTDNSTNTTLLHGIVEVDLNYQKRG